MENATRAKATRLRAGRTVNSSMQAVREISGLEKFTLQDRHRVASQNDSITFNRDVKDSAPFRGLIRNHRSLPRRVDQ